MLRATVIATDDPKVIDRTGIVRRHDGELWVQFDDLELGPLYTHAWWPYDPEDLVLVRGPHFPVPEEIALARRAGFATPAAWLSLRREFMWASHWLRRRLREMLGLPPQN